MSHEKHPDKLKNVHNLEDIFPLTYFIRKGGLCYVESGCDAKFAGIHVMTIADSHAADIIVKTLNDSFKK